MIRVIKSAYSARFGSDCYALNLLQCVVFANIAVSDKSITNTSQNIDFDSI